MKKEGKIMEYTKKQLEKMMAKKDGSLYLQDCTGITSLPDNLTVGGWLDLRGTGITNKDVERRKVKGFFEGKERPNAWLYCDGTLLQYKRKKKIGEYTYYFGRIPKVNVIFDGENYAHCESFKEGVLDLEFKKAKDRGADVYKNLTLESELTKEEAITAYRVITDACKVGTNMFLNSLKEIKDKYTVAEIIEITKGQYGSATFKNFFVKVKDE